VTETAGEAGTFMLGNMPAAGAERGQVDEPRGVFGCVVSIGAGLGLLVFSLLVSASSFLSLSFSLSRSFSVSLELHSQLSSDRAVEGALSICSPFSFSESSEFAEVLLELLVLVLLNVLLAVLVRCMAALPVCGGEAMLGETMDIALRKSMYATGGVIGVFSRSCSILTVALRGPAEGRPAEGSPAERKGSRNADVREIADRGVLSDTAEGSDTAERASAGGGGMLGKFAVTGVDSVNVGLVDMMECASGVEVDRRCRTGRCGTQLSRQVNDLMYPDQSTCLGEERRAGRWGGRRSTGTCSRVGKRI